ncbi:hypothetical protein BJ742DRAFT_851206 [Cladochytrium replicatum]|nr:hypothetical protein BJ742DRAFT_851206 [Cladochytrium replicatum]
MSTRVKKGKAVSSSRRSRNSQTVEPELLGSGLTNAPSLVLFSGTSPSTKSPGTKRMSSASRERCVVPKGGHPYDLIPEEMWLNVFPLLDLGALRTLRNVCSTFHMLTRDGILELSIGEEPLKGLYDSVCEEIRILDELSSGSSGGSDEEFGEFGGVVEDDMPLLILGEPNQVPGLPPLPASVPSTPISMNTIRFPQTPSLPASENDAGPSGSGFASGSWGSTSSLHRNPLSRPGNTNSLLTSGINSLSIYDQGASSTSARPSTSEAGPLSFSRSSMVWERSPRLIPGGSHRRSPRLSGTPASTRNSAYLSPKMEKTERKWDIVFQLHHHIDDHITLQLPPEPPKFTDDFTEWVNFDPTLLGLERQTLYDDWYRRGGGRAGKSLSRNWSDREALRTNMTRELKLKVARLWAAGGKFFPFTKTENGQWRQRRKERGILSGFGVSTGVGGTGGSNTSPKEPIGFGSEEEVNGPFTRTGREGTTDGNEGAEGSTSAQNGKKKRWNHRSGEADFQRAIVAPCVSTDYYMRTPGSEGWNDTSSESYTVYARILRHFQRDGNQRVLRFPLGLDRVIRRQLHEAAESLGLRTLSFGDGSKRFLVAVKRDVVVFRDT